MPLKPFVGQRDRAGTARNGLMKPSLSLSGHNNLKLLGLHIILTILSTTYLESMTAETQYSLP